MKISPLALTTAILATTTSTIEARGRGNGGSSKGKGAVEEEVDPCECDGPISTQIYTDGSAPLFTIQEANAAAPEGCVLKVPSDLDLQLVPAPGGTGGFIVPVVADIATAGACVDPASCIEAFAYLDGNPVPASAFAPGEPQPGDTTAFIPGTPQTDPVTGEPLLEGATAAEITALNGLFAYYSCCLASEDTCTAFTAPATMVPTPSPTKGKSGRGGRRLY